MAKKKTNPYKLSLQEKRLYADILADAFGAVNAFDGSDKTLNLMVDQLNLIDEFVQAKNKNQPKISIASRETLEREFSRQAGIKPVTVQDLLGQACEKAFGQIDNPEDEYALLHFLEKNGSEITYSEDSSIKRGEGEFQPDAGKPKRPQSKNVEPRFSWLILGLLKAGFQPADFSIQMGKIPRSARQKSPYTFITLPKIGAQIAVSNRQSEITFISTKIHDLAIYPATSKTDLKKLDGMNTRVLKGNIELWVDDIHKIIGNPDGTPYPTEKVKLSEEAILEAAKLHHKKTGEWPNEYSGYVLWGDLEGEKWSALNTALYEGVRGLSGGSSLHQLLVKHGHKVEKEDLTIEKILAGAKLHHKKTGEWPRSDTPGVIKSGPLKGETWKSIDEALRYGLRGIKEKGSSLHKLLVKHKLKNHMTIEDILKSAKLHYKNTKPNEWPRANSGEVKWGPMKGHTWVAINNALIHGLHGLEGGSSLHKLLVAEGLKNDGRNTQPHKPEQDQGPA